MIDIQLFDPAILSFLMGLAVPLFVYTTRGARPNATNNRLARSNVTGFIDSVLSDDGTDITLTGGVLLLPDGTRNNPVLARSTAFQTGLFFTTNSFEFARSADVYFQLAISDALAITSNMSLAWNNATTLNTIAADLFLGREAAAILQQGADSATPIAQTFKGADGSGTDIAGGHMTAAPGRGTGTGAGGSFRIATAPAGASGSAQNALVDRLVIDSTGLSSMTALQVSSITGAAGYRGIATMNSGTTVVSVAATAAISGAVVLTQILQYVGDVNSQAGFSTGVQSVRAGAFEIVAIGSRAPIDNAPIAWFVLR